MLVTKGRYKVEKENGGKMCENNDRRFNSKTLNLQQVTP